VDLGEVFEKGAAEVELTVTKKEDNTLTASVSYGGTDYTLYDAREGVG